VSVDLTVRLLVRRGAGPQLYTVSVPEDASVLDALEAAGRQDATLVFRHSCHHASCGSCGMMINNRERLACATPAREALDERDPVRLEPLRGLPLVADLAVDPSGFLARLEAANRPLGRRDESGTGFPPLVPGARGGFNRFENCIECGLCVSACPIVSISKSYLGPAVLAAAGRLLEEPRGRDRAAVLEAVNGPDGVWRCRDVYLCTEVCPADVNPGAAIAGLRRAIIFHTQGETQDENSL
jgi:succinate dehydrogenase / fumarate reductase iron-sulfur subunit